MKSRYDWEPITVPNDWSADKDIAECVALVGESNDYFGDSKLQVTKGLDELNEVLERGLRYYGSSELTRREKFANLRLLTDASKRTGSKGDFYDADNVEELIRLVADLQEGLKTHSILAKICKLEAVIFSGLKPESYLQGTQTQKFFDRFEEDFRYCRFILREHDRIMQDANREDNWIILLLRLGDRLEIATDALEESLRLQHTDYEQKMGDPSWLTDEW